MKNQYPTQRIRAFTLIELLVVIAIISILAAILFPVFAQARDRARAASCLSNLKQIGVGVLMYVQDNDERFPLREYAIASGTYDYQGVTAKRLRAERLTKSCPDGTTISNIREWDHSQGVIQPYLKNYQIHNCPSANLAVRQAGSGPQYSEKDFAYGYNHTYIISNTAYTNSASIYGAVPLAAFQVPAETVFLSETAYWTTKECGGSGLTTFAANWAPSVTYPTTHGRHNGFSNVLWADGHAKAHKVTLRTTGSTAATLQIWRENDLGDLLHPNHPKGSTHENYYYLLDKPTS